MKFPIAIEPGTETTAFGVVVPDLPGCFSAGDTLEEAYANAEEAIEAWIEAALDRGDSIPVAAPLAEHRRKRAWRGWLWGIVSVDAEQLDDTIERVNITLPRRVLRAIDKHAAKFGETRSGFLARAAMDEMRRGTG